MNSEGNEMLKIEKNIPFSQGREPSGKWQMLKEMEPGDSVFVPLSFIPSVLPQAAIGAAARNAWGGGNYKTAKVAGGYRLWRLK